MKIDVVLTPDTIEKFRNRKSVVVIDVFRASTTIVTALSHGAERVIPLRTPKEARALKSSFPNGSALLCGERKGVCIDGFDFGNSPREYTRENIEGKTLLFTSTNGSQMIAKAKLWGETVLIAGFVNLSAAFCRILENDHDCLLACSGMEGHFSLEDTVCAGMIVDRMKGLKKKLKTNYAANVAVLVYQHFSNNLGHIKLCSEHGRYLEKIGFEDDLSICTDVDRYHDVPILRNGALVLE